MTCKNIIFLVDALCMLTLFSSLPTPLARKMPLFFFHALRIERALYPFLPQFLRPHFPTPILLIHAMRIHFLLSLRPCTFS
jgi:hypothetical protein